MRKLKTRQQRRLTTSQNGVHPVVILCLSITLPHAMPLYFTGLMLCIYTSPPHTMPISHPPYDMPLHLIHLMHNLSIQSKGVIRFLYSHLGKPPARRVGPLSQVILLQPSSETGSSAETRMYQATCVLHTCCTASTDAHQQEPPGLGHAGGSAGDLPGAPRRKLRMRGIRCPPSSQ